MTLRRALLLLSTLVLALLLAAPAAAEPTGVFADTEGSHYEDAVAALVELDVLRGCDDDRFCPRELVSRGQVATLVAQALGLIDDEAQSSGQASGSDATSAGIADDEAEADEATFEDAVDSIHRPGIEAAAEAGLVVGCDEGRFCPQERITRAQLATIIVNAFELPAAPADETFFDDAGGVHGPAVDSLAANGVGGGCGLVEFCPGDELRRSHAAMFLARAMELVDRVELAPYEERSEEHAEQLEAEREAAEARAAEQFAASPAGTAVDVAMEQVGKPYSWGGNGPSSFDCSGLTRYAWAAAGVDLPRSSGAQYSATTRISRSDLRPGDLVFYHSPISHVAMYIGDGKVVEAANARFGVRVREDGLTRSGIVGYGRVS